MDKLKVSGPQAKASSNLKLTWIQAKKDDFEKLREALKESLSLYQVQPDQPFQLSCDALHTEQVRYCNSSMKGSWSLSAFLSRKLTPNQVNWSPREKEAYAIAASLIKWASWIGTQTVTLVTDHKSIESWVREYVETPSGPTGGRARWHKVFSLFILTIQYQPGRTNVPADCMSRNAYPASSERQDGCSHGSSKNSCQVLSMVQHEMSISLTSSSST